MPNTVFEWPKGRCLRALREVTVAFPGALLRDGAALGSIIEVSRHDTTVGFVKSPTRPEGYSYVVLELAVGTSATVKTDTEAVIWDESGVPVEFEDLSGPNREILG